MDDDLKLQLVTVMTDAGLPADSSEEIAFHLALHYPSHARALLAYEPTTTTPPAEPPAPTEGNTP